MQMDCLSVILQCTCCAMPRLCVARSGDKVLWEKLDVLMGPLGCNLKACMVLDCWHYLGRLWNLYGECGFMVEEGWPLKATGHLSSKPVFLGLAAVEKVLAHTSITTHTLPPTGMN